ncbi:hypothetical protein EPO15_16695 [bacterium]|nr:MAG: hypothetical protein EPO15_16695 [bacterium]
MRTFALAVLAALPLAAFAAAPEAPAQTPQGPDDKYIQYMKDSEDLGPDPELELQHYHRQLNLTDEQKKKVKKIFTDQRGVYVKSHSLRLKFQAETRALHEKILELNRKFNEESGAIEEAHKTAMREMRESLTAEQKASFDAMQEQRDRQERDWRTRREEESKRREMGPNGAGKDGYMGFGDPPPAGGDQGPKK